MSTVNGGPVTATDGLVLYLNAADVDSYPGYGTTWYDLSRNGNNATLVSSPLYVDKAFTFDGTTQYASVPYSNFMKIPTSTTINIWYYPNSSTANQHMVAYDKTSWIGYSLSPFGGATYCGTAGSNDFNKYVSPQPSLNNWYMMTFVINRENSIYNLYHNGVLNQTGVISQPAISYNANLYIGSRQGPDLYFSGKISQLSYYTKSLSSTEILQYYTSTKGQFV